MRMFTRVAAIASVLIVCQVASAEFSFNGDFTSNRDDSIAETLSATAFVTTRTFSYAGGTNYHGAVIAGTALEPSGFLFQANRGQRRSVGNSLVARSSNGSVSSYVENTVAPQDTTTVNVSSDTRGASTSSPRAAIANAIAANSGGALDSGASQDAASLAALDGDAAAGGAGGDAAGASANPEPASFVIWSLAGLATAAMIRRRRNRV